jgi:CubicO group peptidase (beta-lactamase class C family)
MVDKKRRKTGKTAAAMGYGGHSILAKPPLNQPLALKRRRFLQVAGLTASAYVLGCKKGQAPQTGSGLDRYIEEEMARVRIPGLSASIVNKDGVIWSKGYGYANLEAGKRMTADHVENLGSISKTFVATALMQLWEKKSFHLGDDVNHYLPFRVRNPRFPENPITVEHLLTHTSSIDDGPAYGRSYACGDPKESLSEWHRSYFTPGGAAYDPERNFHPWEPGTSRPLEESYCNVAFGLLAILVEKLSGRGFEDYCQAHIFRPLEMHNTSWYIKNIDISTHAVPYTWVEAGKPRGPSWGGRPIGVIREGGPTWEKVSSLDGHIPNCFYNHPNFSDGFLRSSVSQLGRYVQCYLNKGTYHGTGLLEEGTVETMLTKRNLNVGLCWQEKELTNGGRVWGHLGNDPGINNLLLFDRRTGIGTVILANTNLGPLGGVRMEIATRLFQEAARERP